MSTLAVIGTFYQRHDRTEPLLRRVLLESTRPPDEFWIMCEGEDDVAVAVEALGRIGPQICAVHFRHLPTPMIGDRYAEIPYSRKINAALDRTDADLIVYLDNGSMPHPDKYAVMAGALEQHPDWGATYCGQHRTGYHDRVVTAEGPIADAYCVLNYTQVMHRCTPDRWTLDMRYASPDLADAMFWRSLHASLGAFHPVGSDVLDEHHMEGPQAVGI